MFVRQTVLALCIAALVAAVSSPAAVGAGFDHQADLGHGGWQCLTGAPGPLAVLYAPVRNPQHGVREPHPVSSPPGVAVVHSGPERRLCGQLATTGGLMNAACCGASLLSLHCVLII